MSCYLSYDLKGIQSFIFSIPKLPYIIGGSSLIDSFDRHDVRELDLPDGVKLVFAAAGKGVFYCPDDEKAILAREKILAKAREYGFTICFSIKADYLEAVNSADSLYSYIPESLEGHPCAVSGLYPVMDAAGKGRDHDIHPVVEKRIYSGKELLRDLLEERLLNKDLLQLPPGFQDKKVSFFRSVSSGENSRSEGRVAEAAARAIGSRNRWAVICMDGNDMGRQFQKLNEIAHGEGGQTPQDRIGKMSEALDECSHYSALRGIQEVIRLWGNPKNIASATCNDQVVLPVRPIAVGGDDLIVLCHCGYAFDFVREACRAFNEKSRELDKQNGGLWPATNGELTISAGILFCPVSLPLHTAISYTENLLASAKTKGRRQVKDGQSSASPACFDWEQVTDGMIDTPAARRQREMSFHDEDIAQDIQLTCRPYLMDDMGALLKRSENYSREVPGSIQHQVLPGLRQGFFDRQIFLARLGKNRQNLSADLSETLDKVGGLWQQEGAVRSTPVIDSLLILEERQRMANPSIDQS